MDDEMFKESVFEKQSHIIAGSNQHSELSLLQIGAKVEEKADHHSYREASAQRATGSRGAANKASSQSQGRARRGRMSSVSEEESGAIADDDFMEPSQQNWNTGMEHIEEGQIDESGPMINPNDLIAIKRATQSQSNPSNLMKIL